MITTFYPPYHFGGDATYVRALSCELVARGHDVTVVHCQDAYALRGQSLVDTAVQNDGVTVHRLKSALGSVSPLITQQLGVPGLKARPLREILSQAFDVVNFHNISLVGGPGVLRYSQAPVTLYTLHEHWLLCPTHIFWKNRQRPCDSRECIRCSVRSGIPPQMWRYGSFLRNCLEHVDRFLAPSDYTATRHCDLLPVEDRMAVLPLFAMNAPASTEQSRDTSGRFLFVGRLTAAKGIGQLLDSFARWPQFSLDVVGEGELGSELRQRFANAPNIRFLGALPQADLGEHYRCATALVMPSLAPETFGLTVIEAFAFGTPAIVRVAGGNRELIDKTGAGFVYEDEAGLLAALEHFSQDNQATSKLGSLARDAYLRDYTPERHVEGYLENIEIVRQRKENLSPLR